MAYAAVISLKLTIERHINPTNPEITNHAYEELKYLGNFFREVNAYNYRSINKRAINAFDAKIREAVCRLEDVVESYVFHQCLSPPESLGEDPPADEESVEEEVDLFLKTVRKLEEKYNRDRRLPENEDVDVSPIEDSGRNKSTAVVLWDQYESIRYGLNWDNGMNVVQVMSLVGMAGIGKTHLARHIYQLPTIVGGFGITAWVTAGPKARGEDVLVDILAQIERRPRNLYMEKDINTLGEQLKKKLNGWRYLIVLDDIWRTDVCSYLITCLPCSLESKLILTTRLQEVAKSNSTQIYHIRFMNNQESWDLLWQNVFGGESFPPELEKAGRKIAENCEGLPLLILVVADILRGVPETEEYWMKIAERKTNTFRDANSKISKVLFPSYEYLPQHLKACFLYLGVFPHSYKIARSKLINLWIAENFFEPSEHGDLQDFSVECLEELISNSVVIACKKSSDNRTKSCKLHTSFWHLCVKEARKTKFFLALNKLADCSSYHIAGQRRLSVQNNVLFGIKQVYDLMAETLTARSLLCTGPDHQYPVPICSNLMFLKVLDALAVRFYEFPTEVAKLLQLRYLALTHNGQLHSSISNFQQLQCLILRQHHNIKLLRDSTFLPKEIWDLQQLRHLRIMGSNLPNPSHRTKVPNLSTLHVNAHSCTKDVFRSIPNLRKLGITIELQPDDVGETSNYFKNILTLGGLESLKCVVVNPHLKSQIVAPPHQLSNLPRGLKKLSLNGLGYSWKYMNAIGSLPTLTVLKLRCSAFQGAEWEMKAGKFGNLETLLLEDMDLMHWTIYGDKCFPRLRRLIVGNCYRLKMIPQKIGFIRTLETMEIVDCGQSLVASAHNLRYPFSVNSSLKIVITSSWKLR